MSSCNATAVPPPIRRSRTVDPASTFHGTYAHSRVPPSSSITVQELGDTHLLTPDPRGLPVGESTLEYTLRWRISPWSSLLQNTEYRSPQALIDDLHWSIKLFKGRLHNPKVVSVYLGCDDTMLGLYKRVRLTFQVENSSNPRAQSYSLPEQPVWFSSQHLTWGEAHLLDMETVDSLVYEDTLVVSVHVHILQSKDDFSFPLPDPLTILYNIAEFADTTLRVSWDNVDFCEFHVHRAILACQSTYFAQLLYNSNFAEASTYNHFGPSLPANPRVITLRDTDPDVFTHLIAFAYRHQSSSSTEVNAKLTIRSRPHQAMDFEYRDLSLEELSACMELAHRYQVPLWTQMLLITARLRVQDSSVWDIWRLGDLYGCDATVERAKAHIAANFIRISVALINWKPADSTVDYTDRNTTYLHSNIEATTSQHMLQELHSDLGESNKQHPLCKILVSQIKQVLAMDPLNVDSEEQVFLFFSHWVLQRFVKRNIQALSDTKSMPNTPLFTFIVPNPHDVHQISSDMTVVVSQTRHSRTLTDPIVHHLVPNTSSIHYNHIPSPSFLTDLHLHPNEDPRIVIHDGIRLIRWPLMQKEFLVFNIQEEHAHLFCWPEVREVLRETYCMLLAHAITGTGLHIEPRKAIHSPASWIPGG